MAEGSNPSALTIYKSLFFKDFFHAWCASFVASHLLKNSLIPCTYKNGSVKNKPASHTFKKCEAHCDACVMQFRKYSHHFSPNIRLGLRKNVFYYMVELPRVKNKQQLNPLKPFPKFFNKIQAEGGQSKTKRWDNSSNKRI